MANNGHDEIRWFCVIRYDWRSRQGCPATVIRTRSEYRETGLCVLCPEARQAKGYAFEVALTHSGGTTSVLLTDHLRNDDWKAQNVRLIHRVAESELS